MSECVVRMEIPENCCECQLRQDDYDTGEEFCPFTGVECLSIGRQDNCPIVCALPEGHGRLVDADEAMEKLIHYGFRAIDMTVHECIEDEIATIVPADAERSET